MKRSIPWLMIFVRAAFGPGIILAERAHSSGLVLAVIILIGLVDDVLDGMVARRWNTDTPHLRLADSIADTIFYLGAAVALWYRSPQILRENAWLLLALFSLEAFRYLFDFIKYRRGASYHSYLAKAWGLVLAAALVGAFLGAAWLVRTAILLGIVVNLEGLTMSLLLPRWQNDVKTLPAAMRLRRAMIRDTSR